MSYTPTAPGDPSAAGHSSPRPEPNTPATAGFVVSLIAALVALIPLVGTISWLLAPVGIVLAIVGLTRATPSRPGSGRGLAIAGVLLGIVALLICTVYVTAIAKTSTTTPYYTPPPTPTYSLGNPGSSSGYSGSSTYGSSSGSSGYGTSATPLATYTAPATDPNSFSAGTYEVGAEIKPGTYKTPGGGFCYYSRLRDLDNSTDSIIKNDIVKGPGIMTVASSDKYVELTGPCTWTKK